MRLLPPEGVKGVDKVRIPRVSYQDLVSAVEAERYPLNEASRRAIAPPSSTDPEVRFAPLPFPLTDENNLRRNIMLCIRQRESAMAVARNQQQQQACADHARTGCANESSIFGIVDSSVFSDGSDPHSQVQHEERLSVFKPASSMYAEGVAQRIADPWSPPPPPVKLEQEPPKDVLPTRNPSALRALPSCRATASLRGGTVSLSGKALQPPVQYTSYIGNEGIVENDASPRVDATPTQWSVAPHRVMRVPILHIHSRISDALCDSVFRLQLYHCTDPFTAGETYEGACDGASHPLANHLRMNVWRFFDDHQCSTGTLLGTQPPDDGRDTNTAVFERACLITKTFTPHGAVCASLGMRCLFAADEMVVTDFVTERNCTFVVFVGCVSEFLPLRHVVDAIRREFPPPVAAAASVYIMKLVLRTLQKLAGRRIVHGALDRIDRWMVGFVPTGPQEVDILLLPVGWDHAIDFRVFANSEVGQTLPLQYEENNAASTDNEEDCADRNATTSHSAWLHFGYDMCATIPALAAYLDIANIVESSAVEELRQLTAWAALGGHSAPEYSLKIVELLTRMTPKQDEVAKSVVPWCTLLAAS